MYITVRISSLKNLEANWKTENLNFLQTVQYLVWDLTLIILGLMVLVRSNKPNQPYPYWYEFFTLRTNSIWSEFGPLEPDQNSGSNQVHSAVWSLCVVNSKPIHNRNLGWVSPKIYLNWTQVNSDNEYLDSHSFEHCHNNSCDYNIPNMCLFEKKTTWYANLDWSSSGSYASNPIFEHHMVTRFWKWKLIQLLNFQVKSFKKDKSWGPKQKIWGKSKHLYILS